MRGKNKWDDKYVQVNTQMYAHFQSHLSLFLLEGTLKSHITKKKKEMEINAFFKSNFYVSTINLIGNMVHMGRAWFFALEDSYLEGMLYLNCINGINEDLSTLFLFPPFLFLQLWKLFCGY